MDALNVIDRDAIEYRVIARSENPACVVLHNHMDFWFERHRSSIDQSALLALAFAVDSRIFTVSPRGIELDDIGRVQPGEHVVSMTDGVDYRKFNSWCIPLLANLENQHHSISTANSSAIRAHTATEVLAAYRDEHHQAALDERE